MKDPTWSDDVDAQKAGPDAIGDKMDAAIASLDATLDNMRETRKLRLGTGEHDVREIDLVVPQLEASG